jgi:hypothetical protein
MTLLGKAVAAVVLGCSIGPLCGCASSSLVDRWHDPVYQSPPLGRMLVIAVRKDATKRRIWEDAFANELAQHGVAATTSYTLFPDAPPDTNQIVDIVDNVQTNGIDGILVIRRLPTETNTQYVPGYTSTEPVARYSSYWQRYRTYYREINHPGYVESQAVDIRAIDVTTTGNGGRLIWSATSRTPDPGSVTDVQRDIASLVMAELAQRSIIRAKK